MLFIKKFYQIFILIFLQFNFSTAWSQNITTKISSIEIKDHTILIKVNKSPEYKIFTLNNPNRVSIEILNASIDNIKNINKPDFIKEINFNLTDNKLLINIFFENKFVAKNINFDPKNKIISCDLVSKDSSIGKLVNQIEINKEVFSKDSTKLIKNNIADSSPNNLPTPIKSKESSIQPNEIVIKKTQNSIVKYKIRSPQSNNQKTENASNNNLNPTNTFKKISRKPVIVIDAGHGGKDPGTIGIFARSKEKNITLSYARELAKHLTKENRYKVYLTRDSDIFIPLDKRVAKSRKKKADLFISLHANSINDPQVSGFSIYTLSENSSDKQAELLAQKENQADIINGIDFSGASREITKTLIDLSQRESKNNSARLAKFIINEIKSTDIEILQNTHRFAGFMVLTAPDMAAVLIELGYLSNKYEEKLLNSLSYKRLVAKSLTLSINKYFENYNL